MRDNMSTALVSSNVSAFYDVSDVLCNNYKIPPPTTRTQLKLDKRAVGTPIHGAIHGAIHGVRRHSTSSANVTNGNGANVDTNANDAGKLRDRAMSESDRNQRTQTSRYKTELCRPFEENGTCKYGDKCQFAHGFHELRNLSRHPKYKSELCRTFHTVGFCPYGPRCHFIHNPEERKLSGLPFTEQQTKYPRDRAVERPKLLHFPSAPLGTSFGGDLTPPSDSPTSMTPPPSLFGDDITLSMPLSASVLQTAVNVFNFSQRQRNQQELPMMSPIMSPTISGINSPFGSGPMSPFTSLQQLSAEIEQQSYQSGFPPPPITRQDSSVFFSDNLNDFSRNTFRPPSPPDSLSDPESVSESMGPASPTHIANLSSFPMNPLPNVPSSPNPSLANQRVGRLPIFRGMSHEDMRK